MAQRLEDYSIDLKKRIGRGTIGDVHRGRLDVAVKKITHKTITGDTDTAIIAAAEREIEILQKLRHENVVKLIDFSKDDRAYWIILEYCDKGNLEHYLKNNVLKLTTKVKIMKECASGIEYLHSLTPPVYHFDIKPANILLKTDNDELVAKISDFSGSTMLGTTKYIAPELKAGNLNVKSTSGACAMVDIYSLGLSFKEVLQNPVETKDAELVALIDKMTLFDPDNRPSSSEVSGVINSIYKKISRNLQDSTIEKAFQSYYDEICFELNLDLVTEALYSNHVIDYDRQTFLTSQSPQDLFVRNSALLDLFLAGEERLPVHTLMSVLKSTQPQIYSMIQHDSIIQSNIEDIKQHLQEIYKTRKYNIVTCLPGEQFKLDLSNVENLMPFDFSVELIQEDSSENLRAADICNTDYTTNENIIKLLQLSDSPSFVLCTAHSGYGKSVLCKYIVSEYIKQSNAVVNKFPIMLYLPLLNIQDIHSPIANILRYSKTGDRGLLTGDMMDTFIELCDNPVHASKIMFIIDDIDSVHIPVQSDLFTLITRQLFPLINIFLVSRPETTLLTSLKPDLRVCLNGTTTNGVFAYLRPLVKTRINRFKLPDVKSLIKLCQDQYLELDALRIPLYLTFVHYAFNCDFINHFSFKDLMQNNTINSFHIAIFTVLLRKWLFKSGRCTAAQDIICSRNPIDKSSNIPIDIKRTLMALGKMSFDLLAKQKFDFQEQDMEDYFIDLRDIQLSGLFHFVFMNGKVTGYYCHKHMQDFLAAIYLCQQQFTEPSFCTMMETIRGKSLENTLFTHFNHFPLTLLFVFGMSPQFATEILKTIEHCFSVTNKSYYKYGSTPSISLDYEAWLCYEADEHEHLNKAMKNTVINYLNQKPVYIGPSNIFQYNLPKINLLKLYKLVNLFNQSEVKEILDTWYGIQVEEDGPGQWIIKANAASTVNYGQVHNSGTFQLSTLFDDLLFFLLCDFRFPAVHFLKIPKSATASIHYINRLFPNVKEIVIGIDRAMIDEFLDYNGLTLNLPQNSKSLQDIHIYNVDENYDVELPTCSVLSLLHQTQLICLQLHRLNIFPSVLNNLVEVNCPNLQYLELVFSTLDDNTCELYLNGLRTLLTSVPQLRGISLGCYYNNCVSFYDLGCQLSLLLTDISKNCPHLSNLILFNILSDKIGTLSDPVHIHTICKHISTITGLKSLGLGTCDIWGREVVWLKNMSKLIDKVALQVIYRPDNDLSQVDTVVKKLFLGKEETGSEILIERREWKV